MTPPPWIVGHRGAKARRPENSLEGFAWAAENGVATVELDVRLSRDGVPVCSHDATLKHAFGRPDRVSGLSAGELRGLGMPTLEEALDVLLGRCSVIVELKASLKHSEDQAPAVVDLLRRRREAGRVDAIHSVSSFSPRLIASFVAANTVPAHPAALLSSHAQIATRSLQHARELGCRQFHVHYTAVLREPWIPRTAGRLGLPVAVYTVNRARLARHLRRIGVEWVITDDPLLLGCNGKPVG